MNQTFLNHLRLLVSIGLASAAVSCESTTLERSGDRLDRRLEVRDSRLDTSLNRIDQREDSRSNRWKKRSDKADAQAERRWERRMQ